MRDKFESAPQVGDAARVAAPASPKTEAVDALVSLGYKVNEVNKLIGNMDIADKSAEDIIRQALKQAVQ